MTAHIKALKEEIADVVIMPGDPLRAKFIAETYLKDYKLVNDVRNMLAYTGYYKNKLVTVMGSGMGMPSIGIYSYELFKFYDVSKIIRVGTCGSYTDELDIFDIVLVSTSFSDSSYAYVQSKEKSNYLDASVSLNNKIKEIGKINNIDIKEGIIYSSDVFYKLNDDYLNIVKNHNCLGVEMESFALFNNAKILNKEASCILTVSNSFINNKETTIEEREKSFIKMIELALDSI